MSLGLRARDPILAGQLSPVPKCLNGRLPVVVLREVERRLPVVVRQVDVRLGAAEEQLERVALPLGGWGPSIYDVVKDMMFSKT